MTLVIPIQVYSYYGMLSFGKPKRDPNSSNHPYTYKQTERQTDRQADRQTDRPQTEHVGFPTLKTSNDRGLKN